MMKLEFYDIQDRNDDFIKIAVIIAKYKEKWVFCKNKNRGGWESPGGHREESETIFDAAKRELYEETGAKEFTLTPVCLYYMNDYTMLFYAEISKLDELPEYEIEKIDFFEDLPKDLSFPTIDIQLFQRVKEFLDSNLEIWDAYYPDETLASVNLVRGQRIPREYRHAVVEIFVLHEDGDILLMQRDKNKPNYPGLWESGAGGSVLKGESFEEGAKRELREETGIIADALYPSYKFLTPDTIYKGYICYTATDKNKITLQYGETIGYRWVNTEEFLQIYETMAFVPSLKERIRGIVDAELVNNCTIGSKVIVTIDRPL